MPDQLEAVAEEVVQCAEQCSNDFSIEIYRECREFIAQHRNKLSPEARALFVKLGLSELLEEKHAHTGND